MQLNGSDTSLWNAISWLNVIQLCGPWPFWNVRPGVLPGEDGGSERKVRMGG